MATQALSQPSVCQERLRLQQEYEASGTLFASSERTLQTRIGVTSKREFKALSHSVDTAWDELKRARFALDDHIRSHGCGT